MTATAPARPSKPRIAYPRPPLVRDHRDLFREAVYRDAPARLELDESVRPVAAGQSAVFYRLDAPSLVRGAGIVAP